MAKTTITKYLWLVYTIRRYGKITLPQLQDEWAHSTYNTERSELIRRTFINHKSAAEEIFDITIKVNGNNQYYIEDEGAIDYLHNLLLDSFAVSNIFNMSPELKGRILYEEMPSGREYMVKILEAMKMSRCLRIDYRKFGKDEAKERVCNPLALKAYAQRWYLIAQSKSNGWIYPLALDRIKSLTELEETFTMPADFDAETYFRHYIGITVDEDQTPEKILFRTKGNTTNYIRTLPFHHSQQELRTEGDWTYFEIYIIPTFEFLQTVLAQATGLEVLEPIDLRNEIRETIKAMHAMY